MKRQAVELSNVIYNAASQSFEAIATIYQEGETVKIACAINAPINMSFKDAANGLMLQAKRRLAGRTGLRSHRIQEQKVPQRLARRHPARHAIDPIAMLRRLVA